MNFLTFTLYLLFIDLILVCSYWMWQFGGKFHKAAFCCKRARYLELNSLLRNLCCTSCYESAKLVLFCGIFQMNEMCILFYFVSYYLFSLLCSTTLDPYDTDQMAREFLLQFSGQAFTVGQQLAFSFFDKKLLGLVIKSLEGKNGHGTWPWIVTFVVGKCIITLSRVYCRKLLCFSFVFPSGVINIIGAQ